MAPRFLLSLRRAHFIQHRATDLPAHLSAGVSNPVTLISTSTEVENLRALCAATTTWEQYSELAKRVRTWPIEKQWDLLSSLLLNYTEEQSDRIAGCLLIDIEPSTPHSLEELLAAVAKSSWSLSNRELPFYLVATFGKHSALSAIDGMLPCNLSAQERTRIEGVQYWAKAPASYLAGRLHYFEWQEAIEHDG